MTFWLTAQPPDCRYPKKLAFQYLEELAGEFGRLYGTQVDAVQRPYAFIKFGEHLFVMITATFISAHRPVRHPW